MCVYGSQRLVVPSLKSLLNEISEEIIGTQSPRHFGSEKEPTKRHLPTGRISCTALTEQKDASPEAIIEEKENITLK